MFKEIQNEIMLTNCGEIYNVNNVYYKKLCFKDLFRIRSIRKLKVKKIKFFKKSLILKNLDNTTIIDGEILDSHVAQWFSYLLSRRQNLIKIFNINFDSYEMPVKDVINIDRYEINDMIVENKKNIYSVKFLQKDVQLAGLLIEKKITTLKLFFDFNVRKIVIKDEELLPQNLTILEFISKLRETNKVTIEFDNAEQASTITYPILMNNEEIFTIKFCD